jgi:hypothetical protein
VTNCDSGSSGLGTGRHLRVFRPDFVWRENGVARKKEMTLVGAKTRRLQKRAKRDWSAAKARGFLGVLAETCNVSEACRQSGVGMTVAYRRRKMDASFRASWGEAIAVAYQRLELVLLERAFNGTTRTYTRKDGSEERMHEYSNQLGLTLLKMHRETAIEANSEVSAEDADEIRERLVQKLQRLKRRDEEQKAQGAELRGDAPRDGHAEQRDGGAAAPDL